MTDSLKRSHDEMQDKPDDSEYFLLSASGDHRRAVSSVAVAPPKLTKNKPGAYIVASASADGLAKIWDLQHHAFWFPKQPCIMEPLVTCAGHSRGINEVSWNPQSMLLATASDDKTVRIWDAVTGDGLVELRGHTSFVFSVDQHYSLAVTGSFDESVKVWDIRTGDSVLTVPAHSDPVTAVRFSRDGTTICSASHDGLMRLWDTATGECLKTWYAAQNPPVSAVSMAPNSRYVLASTLDSTLRLWPVTSRASPHCLKTYTCKAAKNTKFSVVAGFTHDGKSVFTGNETGNVLLYDLQSTKLQQVLKHGDKDPVLAVSSHKSAPLICTGGMDKRVRFWAKQELIEQVGAIHQIDREPMQGFTKPV